MYQQQHDVYYQKTYLNQRAIEDDIFMEEPRGSGLEQLECCCKGGPLDEDFGHDSTFLSNLDYNQSMLMPPFDL